MRCLSFLLLFIFMSCDMIPNCNGLSKHYRDDESCELIVEVTPKPSSVYFKASGRDPKTGKQCGCDEESRWWQTFSDEIEVGDTIIKRKGELTFYIHKKDTVIVHHYECDEKFYK